LIQLGLYYINFADKIAFDSVDIEALIIRKNGIHVGVKLLILSSTFMNSILESDDLSYFLFDVFLDVLLHLLIIKLTAI